MTQNTQFLVTPELTPAEMEGIRGFVAVCRTGQIWRFDDKAVKDAEKHINNWFENRSND